MPHRIPAPVLSLLDMPPTRLAWQMAAAVVGICALLFIVAIEFVRLPMPRISAFLPSYESALTIVELLSALLLIAQYSRTKSLRKRRFNQKYQNETLKC
jgi:hypothetical protein